MRGRIGRPDWPARPIGRPLSASPSVASHVSGGIRSGGRVSLLFGSMNPRPRGSAALTVDSREQCRRACDTGQTRTAQHQDAQAGAPATDSRVRCMIAQSHRGDCRARRRPFTRSTRHNRRPRSQKTMQVVGARHEIHSLRWSLFLPVTGSTPERKAFGRIAQSSDKCPSRHRRRFHNAGKQASWRLTGSAVIVNAMSVVDKSINNTPHVKSVQVRGFRILIAPCDRRPNHARPKVGHSATSGHTPTGKVGVLASGKLEKGGRDSNSETFHCNPAG